MSDDVVVKGTPLNAVEPTAELTPIDWVDEAPNANNERVAVRLRADKEQLTARLRTSDITTSSRVGSPFNPGDLANGGMGGDLGASAIIRERGVAEDAAQHAAADAAAGRLQESRGQAMDGNGWGKPLATAEAAASDLLGNDAPPAGTAGLAGNPDTAPGKANKGKAAPGEFKAPV